MFFGGSKLSTRRKPIGESSEIDDLAAGAGAGVGAGGADGGAEAGADGVTFCVGCEGGVVGVTAGVMGAACGVRRAGRDSPGRPTGFGSMGFGTCDAG